MNKIYEASSDVKPWLEEHHSLKWFRSKFLEEIKCDHITNNLVESWNNWVKESKDLPIADLADTLWLSSWSCMQKGEELVKN